MTNKYIKWSFPKDAHGNLKKKTTILENEFYNMTGKKRRIPMTKVMDAILKKPVIFYPREIIELGKSRKKMFGGKLI